MARGGINKALVQRARQALLARGEHPSIDAVRAELGNTGSKTTIHRYMKELDENDPRQTGGHQHLSAELGDLVARLAERLREEAESELRAAQEVFAAERASLAQQAEQDRIRIGELEQRSAGLEQALSAEQAAHQQLRDNAQQMLVELARLDQLQRDQQMRLDERAAQIRSLEEKHQHAREALEHYRTSVKEQREQEQRRHEGQVQQLQVELRQGQQMLIIKQEEVLQLNRDNERLLGEARSVQRERSALQEQLARQSQEQAGLQMQLTRLETLNASLLEQLNRTEAAQVELRGQLEDARTRRDEQARAQQQAEQALHIALARAQAELQLLRAASAEALKTAAPAEVPVSDD